MDQLPNQDKGLRIPFTNNLDQDLFTQWFTYSYWERLRLHDVLEDALREYLKDRPNTRRPLPPRQQTILDAKIQKERSRIRKA